MILKTPGQIVRAVIVIVAAAFLLGFVSASLAKSADPQIVDRDLHPIYGRFLENCQISRGVPGSVQRHDTIEADGITWYLIVRYQTGYAMHAFIQKEVTTENVKTVTYDGMRRDGVSKNDAWKDYCSGHDITYTVEDGDLAEPFKCENPGSIWSEGIELFKKKYRR